MTLYEKMFEVVRPLINQQDIVKQKEDSLTFNFIDPIHGRVELRLYSHEGAAVLTSWENKHIFNGGSLAYVLKADEPKMFKSWEKIVTSYLTNPWKHYEEPMLEKWRYIESQLREFVDSYGSSRLVSKILDVPVFTDEEKVKLLSYLNLAESVRAAKEREALWELSKKQKVES